MIIDDKIKNDKLQHDINRAEAKTFALSLGKVNKYENLTGEEIPPPQQHRIIQEAKFSYLPLGKEFGKQ